MAEFMVFSRKKSDFNWFFPEKEKALTVFNWKESSVNGVKPKKQRR